MEFRRVLFRSREPVGEPDALQVADARGLVREHRLEPGEGVGKVAGSGHGSLPLYHLTDNIPGYKPSEASKNNSAKIRVPLCLPISHECVRECLEFNRFAGL